jgi:AAA family ATP:ADP antiporter
VSISNQSISGRLSRLVSAEPHELRALGWSFLYFFVLLCAYYILRPIRDEMGIRGGVENLQWLFTATFVTMLCVVPLFGWVSSRYSRGKLLVVVYGFFIVNIVLFYFLFASGVNPTLVARVFFVWLSVFNLFVVSVFWSFMVELYDDGQSKRLFGFIAAGGSAGAVVGPALTASLSVPLGTANLLWVSALFLSIALICIHRLRAWAGRHDRPEHHLDANPIGGNWFDGIKRVARSPYLLGICLYILLYTTLATFLYFTQAGIVRDAFATSEERTRVFALIDFGTNALTIGLQLFVTGRLASRFGLSVTLAVVPFFLIIGFTALATAPVLIVLLVVQIVRRAGNYAIARPGREMLYTVLPVADKYKSKNFIDTVIYRGGDAVSGWAYAGFTALGLTAAGIAWVAVPVALIWLVSGWRLGKARARQEHHADTPDVAPVLIGDKTP